MLVRLAILSDFLAVPTGSLWRHMSIWRLSGIILSFRFSSRLLGSSWGLAADAADVSLQLIIDYLCPPGDLGEGSRDHGPREPSAGLRPPNWTIGLSCWVRKTLHPVSAVSLSNESRWSVRWNVNTKNGKLKWTGLNWMELRRNLKCVIAEGMWSVSWSLKQWKELISKQWNELKCKVEVLAM